jgi:hypothetical protein
MPRYTSRSNLQIDKMTIYPTQYSLEKIFRLVKGKAMPLRLPETMC